MYTHRKFLASALKQMLGNKKREQLRLELWIWDGTVIGVTKDISMALLFRRGDGGSNYRRGL